MTVAVSQLKQLEEIIFCFDQDKAGKEAIKKYSENLRVMNPEVQLSNVELPNNDVNETLQLHDETIFTELLNNRKNIFLSTEESDTRLKLLRVENTGISTKENLLSGNRTQTKDLQNPIDFLQQKELLQNLNGIIEKAGIIGEENSRLLLFLITISLKQKSITRNSTRKFRKRENPYHQQNCRYDAAGRCTEIYKNYRIKFVQLG